MDTDFLTPEKKEKIKAAPDGQRFSLRGREYVKRGNALVASDTRPLGTQSVLSPEESRAALPPGGRPLPTPLRGPAPAFPGEEIRQGIPPLLQTAREWVPMGTGMLAAGVTAPLAAAVTGATAGGATAPATAAESMAFAAGEQAGDIGMNALTRALGYTVPGKSAGERGLEFAGSSLTYPLVGAALERVPSALRRVTGITSRREAQQAAAEDASSALAQLHSTVADTVEKTTGKTQVGLRKAERAARQLAREERAAAPSLIAPAPPTSTELGGRAVSLKGSGLLRKRDVAPIERLYGAVQSGLGAEYEALLKDHLKEDVPDTVLATLRANADDILSEGRQYALPQKLVNLLKKVQQWGVPPEGATVGRVGGVAIPLPAGLSTGEAPKPVKWEELKQLRDQVRPYFTDKHPPSRTTARLIDSSVTNAYADGGLPIDPDLNMRYRDWRQRWNPAAVRTLRDARTPEQLKGIVNENTLGPLLASGDPQARDAVANVVKRIIQSEKLGPTQISKRFSPEVLKAVFGPGADDVSKWATLSHQSSALESLLRASPRMAQQFQNDVNHYVRQASAGGARQVKQSVLKFADSLGKPGADLKKFVSGLSDAEATRFYLERMSSPEFAAEMDRMARAGETQRAFWKRMTLGAVPFAAGLAVMEMGRRGEVTSPYVASVPFALGMEAAVFWAQPALMRMMESQGMRATLSLVRRATGTGTRGAALKALAKKSAQAYVADAWRGASEPGEGDIESQAAMQQLLQAQGGQ